MLFCRLAGVFCSQFRSLSLFIVNFWCFIWYSVHFPPWHAEKTSLSKCQLYGLLSGCQVCPILYISAERVCTLQPGLLACQLSTEMCCTNSASEEEINMYPKSQFQLKKKTLNHKIYEVVNCELWLTLRRLESSQCSFLCWLQISIFIVKPL